MRLKFEKSTWDGRNWLKTSRRSFTEVSTIHTRGKPSTTDSAMRKPYENALLIALPSRYVLMPE
jgi:hypothetical protein